MQRHMDAAVLVGFSPRDLPGVLSRKDLTLVLYDSYISESGVHHVRTDEEKGGAMAAEHVLSIGRSKPVFLGGYLFEYPDNIPAFRYRGAKKVFDKAGVEMDVIEGPTNYTGGIEAARKIKAMGADSVIAVADIIAAGLIEGLRAQGVQVPKDMAVTGYDNLPICEHTRPRITTVDQRLADKVKAVMDLVESSKDTDVRVVEPRLILRESA
jgi:LacI family transcriptional regulator